MKLLQRLTRQLEQTRLHSGDRQWAKYVDELRKVIHSSLHRTHPSAFPHPTGRTQQPLTQTNASSDPAAAPTSQTQVSKPRQQFLNSTTRSPAVLLLAVISLTSAYGYRFYNTPKLDIGKAAPQTIYAPAATVVEDKNATEEERKTARDKAREVLMISTSANQAIYDQIEQQLSQGRELRQIVGAFPFVDTKVLSTPTQRYLRKAPEADWQTILGAIDPALSENSAAAERAANPSNRPSTVEQQQVIAELRNYRRRADLGAYLTLVQSISEARLRYSAALNALPQPSEPSETPIYDAAFLDLTDSEWQQVRPLVIKVADRMLAQGIANGMPTKVLEAAIQLQVDNQASEPIAAIAARTLASSLQPNLVPDPEQSTMMAEQAAQEIKPILVAIRQGDVIVRSGQTIGSGEFALLDHFGLSRRELDWVGLVGFGALVSGAVALVWIVEQRFHSGLRRRDYVLIWLLTLTTPLLIALRVPSTNLPAVGLLVGSFYGSPLGVTVAALFSLLLPIGLEVPLTRVLPSAVCGILCGAIASRLRSREELAILGGAVGVLQGALYLLLNVASGAAWFTLLGSSGIYALIGLAWTIVAIGSSPYLEQLFDLVTPIRMVELANPNRPLLKRLAAEAPGTFQHTLFVATLAEAAARALGCNIELVRAGTLYHDIGKMHDPLGFIENQMGGPNKHDEINDPWKSAEIIKKHVTQGLVMARKARLPKAIQAFIPEHQGTMSIAYFHHQARQRVEQAADAGSELVLNDADFHYDGPIPQSRETGIVMLADSCEAALRSLKDATAEEAQAMVNKILRARWQDNQLVDSGLTREDMTEIAEVFVQVWQQFNHRRIAYPKLSPSPSLKSS